MLPSVQLGRFHLHRNVHSDSHGSNSSGFVAYACQEAVVLRTACVTRSKLYYGYALAILILGVSDRSGALLQKRFGMVWNRWAGLAAASATSRMCLQKGTQSVRPWYHIWLVMTRW